LSQQDPLRQCPKGFIDSNGPGSKSASAIAAALLSISSVNSAFAAVLDGLLIRNSYLARRKITVLTWRKIGSERISQCKFGANRLKVGLQDPKVPVTVTFWRTWHCGSNWQY
jgi:hypothetical protein